jgi:hypothetical protein
MPATQPPSLADLAKYPKMTSWFRPDVLAKLLWRVIASDLFEQYADRRLIVAALDTVTDQELVERAQQFMPGKGNRKARSGSTFWLISETDLTRPMPSHHSYPKRL